ncbi:hypothetical protein D3C83_133710 [compost metagenome]
MATRQPPSPAVDPKNDTLRRTSSTRMLANSLPVFSLNTRSSVSRSVWDWLATRRATGQSAGTASEVARCTTGADGSGLASTNVAMR